MGYGDKAYAHAKQPGGTEDWTREAPETSRLTEYQKRLDIFKKKEGLQELSALKNPNITCTFKKGDTLYPFLTDQTNGYGMNKHTAFFVMVKMLQQGINVDLWQPNDTISLKANGTLEVVRSGTTTEIRNVLIAAPAAAVPPAAPGGASTSPPAGPPPAPARPGETTGTGEPPPPPAPPVQPGEVEGTGPPPPPPAPTR